MELKFEAVLETILVGTIASLSLLSLLFLFFGHNIEIEAVKRVARVAFYEWKLLNKKEVRAAHSVEEPKPEKSEVSFAFLLLIALLFGLGATVESVTHDLVPFDDKNIKTEAFAKVGMGQVQGRTASREFTQFVADFITCKELPVLPSETSPCQEIFRRQTEFYYTAKNAVFKHHTYADELNGLQMRINFVRSACVSLFALAAVALLIALVGTIFEHWVKDPKLPEDSGVDLSSWASIKQHWKDLDAWRCWISFSIVVVLGFASLYAWKKEETQYDRRIYGYYLALLQDMPDEGPSPPWAGEHEEKTREDAAEKTSAVRAAEHRENGAGTAPMRRPGEPKSEPKKLPVSPYRIFALNVETARSHFEPSAIVALDDASRFLVANDKDQQNPFVLFSYSEEKGLHDPRVLRFQEGKDVTGTFEALTIAKRALDPKGAQVRPPGDGGAASALTLVRAVEKEPLQGRLRALVFAVPNADSEEATLQAEELIEAPCAALVPSAVRCFVEGVVERAPDTLLLGVRSVLVESHRKANVQIVEYIRNQDGGNPLTWKINHVYGAPTLTVPCAEHQGISDMSLTERSNELLVLTSVEQWNRGPGDQDICRDDQHAKAATFPSKSVLQIQGALWKVSLVDATPKWDLVQRFIHKPEGVTRLDDELAIVVFDDDSKRKSFYEAPDTFPLRVNESVYTTVRLPER